MMATTTAVRDLQAEDLLLTDDESDHIGLVHTVECDGGDTYHVDITTGPGESIVLELAGDVVVPIVREAH